MRYKAIFLLLLRTLVWISGTGCVIPAISWGQIAPFPDRVVGDVGLAAYSSRLNTAGAGSQTSVAPYGFFDYQRFFARIDTFGIKTLPVGWGYLELVTRVSLDDMAVHSKTGVTKVSKGAPAPLGIGTLQETPYGGLIVNIFKDAGSSRGTLSEALYIGEVNLPAQITAYPIIGVERLSSRYNGYYYGLNTSEASALGYSAYSAGAATNRIASVMLDVPLKGPWAMNVLYRRKWLGKTVSESPVLNHGYQDNALISLVYRYK